MLNISSANFRLAIKTALAGCFAMYFASLLRMPQPYWACISAMIVMQANLGAAVKQSWIRLAATAVGAAVSIPFVAYFGQNLVAFGVAVFVTVLLCTVLHLQDGLRLAAVTIAIIMLVPHTGHAWAPALNRFLEVSLGILVALLVAEFVLPSTALESLRHALAEKFLQHEECMSQAVETLDAACDGAFCGGIDLQWEPEFSELCAGISAALQRIAEGILTGQFYTPEYDFTAALEALDAKASAARTSVTPAPPAAQTLEGVLRSHTIFFALETLARELAAAQITARELVSPSSVPTGAQ